MRRLLIAVGLMVTVVIGVAGPASADPARPTNYLSVITRISPPNPNVTMNIVGGDGFLDLKVARGHTVVVEGYSGEPFLRVLTNGTVQYNTNSPAYYLDKTRHATTKVPARLLGPTLPPPAWKTKGHSGRAIWHDHRIHFMGLHPIGQLAHGLPVYWSVNFTIDGVAHVAYGNYRLLPAPNPLIWLAIIAGTAGLVWLVGRKRQVLVAAIAALAAAPIGLVLGWDQNKVVPKAAGGTPLIVILPTISLIAGIVAIVKRREPAGVVAILAAVACEGGWFLSRTSVLWKSVIPTTMSPGYDRTGSAILIGLAIAGALLAVQSGAMVRKPKAKPKPTLDPEPAADPAAAPPAPA